MSSGFKNYHFHREYHNDLMKNQAYTMLPLDCIGALAKVRNMAGLTDNDGSLKIGGSERLSFKDTCQWLALTPGTTARRSREIMFRLIYDQFLTAVLADGTAVAVAKVDGKWGVAGRCPAVSAGSASGRCEEMPGGIDLAVVVVPEWNAEQHGAPTAGADRKRNQRGHSGRDEAFEEEFRGNSEEFLSDGSSPVDGFPKETADSGVTCPTNVTHTADCRLQRESSPLHCKLSGLAVAAAPPPQLRSRAEQDSAGGTGPEQAVQSHSQTQSQRHRQSQSQTAPSARQGSGLAGQGAPAVQAVQEAQFGGGAAATAGEFLPGDDLYRMDPIDAYCAILGDRKPIAQRNAKSKLRQACVLCKDDDLGRQKFFFALATMRDILKAGTMPERMADGSRCLPWKYFEGVFNNVLDGRV